MEAVAVRAMQATACSCSMSRGAAVWEPIQGPSRLVPGEGFLGSCSAFEALPLGKSSSQGRRVPLRVAAVNLDSASRMALHNVRYIDGETVGDTPKFRQIRMESAFHLPQVFDMSAPQQGGKSVLKELEAVTTNLSVEEQKKAVVKVVGIGYGGGKAVESMLQRPGLEAAAFVLVAADSESLPEASSCLPESQRIVLGLDKLMGEQLKSNADFEDELEAQLDGADLVIVVAGMGGNTGGVPPVVAKVARRVGALTVGLVTKPFAFEGPRRASLAEKHVAMLKKRTDTLIVLPCDQLLQGKDPNFGVRDAFKLVDSVLQHGVKGLTDMVTGFGLVNAKLSDVQSLMTDAGLASIGVGSASGLNRAVAAADAAVAASSLQRGLQCAQGVVYNITGDTSLQLHEVAQVSEIIHSHVGGFATANVLFAASLDKSMEGKVRVTVVAVGLPEPRLLPAERQGQTSRATRLVGASKRSSSIMRSSR